MNRFWNIRCLDPLPCSPNRVPTLSKLQKTLQKGEYLPLRRLSMFESNFVQVTSQGIPVYVHHKTNHLTMGVAASLPGPRLPDLLLIARPSERRDCSNLILTRMIPLNLVHLYVHNLSAWRLKLHLITGRYYYLELDAPDSEIAFLFDHWIHLINLLRESANFWVPRTLDMPLMEQAQLAPPASTWRLKEPSHTRRSGMIVDPTLPHKMQTSQKGRKAKTLKHHFKSQALGNSVPFIWLKLGHPGTRKKATQKKFYPDLGLHSSQTKTQVSGKPSITIRTIFSMFSSTFDQTLSSSKGCSYESDRAVILGGLVDTPSHFMSENNPASSLLGSYDHLDMEKDMGDQMDHKSSTLASYSLGQAIYFPNFYLSVPYSSIPRHNKKARPLGSVQRLCSPSSQTTPSISASSSKAPFILDQSPKVSAVQGPSQMALAGPVASQKTPVLASASQKAPAITGSSRKTPHVLVVPQKTISCPVPNQESLSLPTPSQKTLTSPTQCQDPPDLGTLPVGSHVGNVLERSQPVGNTALLVLVGAQEMKVMGMQVQKMPLELPFNTTKKELKEVVISKAQEITLDGLKGQGMLEDKIHRMKEEKSLDIPGFKNKMMGRQQKWVKTQELAMEGAPQEQRRPFSVEEFTLSKMMIMANAKELSLRPEPVSLHSWFLPLQVSAMSAKGPECLNPSQVATLEGTPVMVREQLWLGPWAKRRTGVVRRDFMSTDRSRGSEAALRSEEVFQSAPLLQMCPLQPKEGQSLPSPHPSTCHEVGRRSVTHLADPHLKDGGQGVPKTQQRTSRDCRDAGPGLPWPQRGHPWRCSRPSSWKLRI